MTPAEREAAREAIALLAADHVESPSAGCHQLAANLADHLVAKQALWLAREASIDTESTRPELRYLALVKAAEATAKVELLDELLVDVLELARGMDA